MMAQLLLGNSEINIFDRENNSIHNTTQLNDRLCIDQHYNA